MALNLEQCKTERERSEGSSDERIVDYFFSSLHHEAEEGGEAVQGDVEELSTGLII